MERTNKLSPRDSVGSVSPDNMFRSLEFHESRKRSVWVSVAVHGVLLTVLLVVPLIFHEAIKVHFDTVLIAPPMPEKQVLEVTHYKEPPPKPKLPEPPKPVVAPPPPKPALIEPPQPKPLEPPKIAEVKLPDVVQREKPLPKSTAEIEAPAVAEPKIEVRTNVFSTGSSAKPTTNLPASQVQTGGFGDPNGIRGEGKPGKPGNIASLGSFDLPVGPGAGNGTGGAHGVKGVVPSAGFGNGVAVVGNGGGGGGSGRAVQKAGFADTEAVKAEPAPKKRDLGPPQTPVEILFKPKPEYTEEARKLKLEGEVLLRVLFTAGGEARVMEVTRGLGHGLDESATRAAQQIRFKPALRDGQPVDSTATVHILFQLAY
jgi:TonB family protein